MASVSGFRAFLPLFLISFAVRNGNLDSSKINPFMKPYFVSNDTVFYILAALAAIEILGDKFPAISNTIEIVFMFVRPAAGALAGITLLTLREPNMNFILGVAFAFALTLPFQSLKSSTRILSDRGDFGAYNLALSFVVDVEAFGGAVLGLIYPPAAFFANPLIYWLTIEGFKKWRVRLIAGEELDVEFQDSLGSDGEFLELKKLKKLGKRK